MIKEIHIDFNKKTIQFEANHYRKCDMTYPSRKIVLTPMFGLEPTIDDLIFQAFAHFVDYNEDLEQHYEVFVKNGKY